MMIGVEDRIKSLGSRFRGLWQVRQYQKDILSSPEWCVTFKYKGEFIETMPRDTMENALEDAIEFLNRNL